MRDKIIGFIISVVCFIISLGFVKGQAMALPFVPTDWTWEMYQGLHMLGDLIANDVNFEVPDWVDFNDFDDVKTFLEMIYAEGKKKVAYASIISDFCVGTWQNFLDTGEVTLPFSESTIKRTHNTGFFQQIADTITDETVYPQPDVNYLSYLNQMNSHQCVENTQNYFWFWNSSSSKLTCYPTTDYTWIMNNGRSWSSYSYQSGPAVASPLVTINITSDNGVYSYSISGTGVTNGGYNGMQFTNYLYSSYGARAYAGANSTSLDYSFSHSGTLAECLVHISSYFKNVNINVDGVPWAYVGGTAIDNPLGVEIPQNVIDEVENGKISGLVIDATLPDTDNLVGSIDLGVVMDELRESQANGRTATLEGVRTKDGIRALDGTVVGTVSKAVSIDVPSTASLVTAADEWGYIPYYPEIPSAFSGTTILSELIDATQTIVPNDLIMAIWGLVIILFIIALINIFHK